MPTYILLTNWTDQGVKNAKASPKRQEDARKLAKKFNVEWKTLFMTMGAYDFVLTVEAPDDAALAKYVVSLCALGNVRTTTLKRSRKRSIEPSWRPSPEPGTVVGRRRGPPCGGPFAFRSLGAPACPRHDRRHHRHRCRVETSGG